MNFNRYTFVAPATDIEYHRRLVNVDNEYSIDTAGTYDRQTAQVLAEDRHLLPRGYLDHYTMLEPVTVIRDMVEWGRATTPTP